MIFYFARRAPKLRYYGDVIHSFYWKSAVKHDGGICSFVMFCVYGKPRSSLLIESTDSMISQFIYAPFSNVSLSRLKAVPLTSVR